MADTVIVNAPVNALVDFAPNGTGAVISYDVPEPIAYSGRHYIELDDIPATSEYFNASAFVKTFDIPTIPANEATLYNDIAASMRRGFYSLSSYQGVSPYMDIYFPGFPKDLFGRLRLASVTVTIPVRTDDSGTAQTQTYGPDGIVYLVEDSGRLTLDKLSPDLQTLTPSEVLAAFKQRKRLKITKSLSGEYSYSFTPVPLTPTPRLAIVEEYRLSSFLGSYGAGRTIKAVSLLPGEKTKITVKTYKKSTVSQQGTQTIFDSFGKESANDFESAVESEATDKEATARSDDWGVEAEVSGNWGTGSAKLSGGVKGGSSSAREQFAKNVSKAAQKHATKASAKRDVKVEMSSDAKTESGEESGVEREIQNLNLGRTLNFVFRQMNQEYYTLLHLVDIRVAYTNGMPEADREVPLHDLDALLREVITPAKRDEVRKSLLFHVENVVDYQRKLYKLCETRTYKNGAETICEYLRFCKQVKSRHTDPVTGASFEVPGVITAVSKNVLRTDGVLVEPILGQGDGLDPYAHGVQAEAGRSKTVFNDSIEAQLALELTKQEIVSQKREGAARAYVAMFPKAASGTTAPGGTT